MLFALLMPFFIGATIIGFVLWRAGKRTNRTWLQVLGGVPFFGTLGLFLFVGGGYGLSVLFPASPAATWQSTFGFPPSADVINIKKYEGAGMDDSFLLMKFQAAPTTYASHWWHQTKMHSAREH